MRANVAPRQIIFSATLAQHRHGTLIYTSCQPNCAKKLYELRYENEAIKLCLEIWRRKGNFFTICMQNKRRREHDLASETSK